MNRRDAWYAGLCPVCGLELLSPGPETGEPPRLELSNGATVPLPFHGRYPVVRHGDPHEYVVSGQDGVAYRVSDGGPVTPLGPVFGLQNVGLTADGRFAWATWLTTYAVEGIAGPQTIPTPDGAVRGWSGDPTQARNWYDDQNLHPLTVRGVRIFNPSWSPDGTWVVGHHPSEWVHLAYHAPTDTLYTAGNTFGTPVAPRLIMRGTEPVIVRSYPSGLVTRDEFVPYVAAPAPPVPPPAPTPAPAPELPAPPAMRRGFLFGAIFSRSNDPSALAIERTGISNAPGNVEIPIRATPEQLAKVTRRVVVEASLLQHVPAPYRYAGYVHLGGDLSGEQIKSEIQQARDEAAKWGVTALFVYDDRVGWRRSLIEPFLRKGDLVSPQWYPGSGESASAFSRRCLDELAGLSGLTVVPCGCAYTRGSMRLTRAEMAAAWGVYFQLAQTRTDLAGLVYFAHLRADGVAGEAAYLTPMLGKFGERLGTIPGVPSVEHSPAPRPEPPQPASTVPSHKPQGPSAAPPAEAHPAPTPTANESELKVRTLAFRRGGHYFTAELGGGTGEVNARATAISAWTTFTTYLLDGWWDVGARVLIETAERGTFVNVVAPQPAASLPWKPPSTTPQPAKLIATSGAGAVFTLARGEQAGTWALVHNGDPVTLEEDQPNRPAVIRPDDTPIQSWQSFEVLDAATGKAYTELSVHKPDIGGTAFVSVASSAKPNVVATPSGSVPISHQPQNFTLSGPPARPNSSTPWLDVTEAQLRHWTGDFGGIRVPAIAPQCPEDPVTGIRCSTDRGRFAKGLAQGVMFSTHFLNYTEAQQDAMLAAYAARGYTHFPINISDAPGKRGYGAIFPPCPSGNPAVLNAALKKIWRAACIPVCIGIGKNDEEGREAARTLAASIEPGLVRIIIPGLEINEDLSDRAQLAARIMNVRAAFPQALMYLHFGPGHGAGDTPEPEWWGRGWKADDKFEYPVYSTTEKDDKDDWKKVGTEWLAHGYDWPGAMGLGVTGFAMQDNNFGNPERTLENVQNQLIRMGGDRDHAGGYWGAIHLDVVLFETQALPAFFDDKSEADCVRDNDVVLRPCYRQEYVEQRGSREFRGRLAGFCNGGTPR